MYHHTVNILKEMVAANSILLRCQMPIFTHIPNILGTMKITLIMINSKFTSLEMMNDDLGYQKRNDSVGAGV